MQKPTYTFDIEGHTVVTAKEEPKCSGLATCAKCGDELIAPEDGQPYWCIECSHKLDGVY